MPRKILYSLLFLSLILASCYKCQQITKVGKGAAGPKIIDAKGPAIWTNGHVELLGLGDSVTRGFGSKRGHSYFELLAHNKDKKHPDMKGKDLSTFIPQLITTNESVNCSDSLDHINSQIKPLKKQLQINPWK